MAQILVVEDDVTTQFMMAEILETLGYGCDVVANADACLERLSVDTHPYDVVLLDLHMPGMSGLAAAEAIRAAPGEFTRRIPIVAVTADVAFHTRSAVARYGLDDVIPKPVDLSELDLTIQKHTG